MVQQNKNLTDHCNNSHSNPDTGWLQRQSYGMHDYSRLGIIETFYDVHQYGTTQFLQFYFAIPLKM